MSCFYRNILKKAFKRTLYDEKYTLTGLPRCDRYEDCYYAKSKKQDGYTYYCVLTDRDVGQSHFGMNSPKCCPLRKANKSDKNIIKEMQDEDKALYEYYNSDKYRNLNI